MQSDPRIEPFVHWALDKAIESATGGVYPMYLPNLLREVLTRFSRDGVTDLDCYMIQARDLSDNGHLTLMRFGSGWKCVLGTPWFDADVDNPEGDYAKVRALSHWVTPDEAVHDAVVRKILANAGAD
jgi:hypothetical protein